MEVLNSSRPCGVLVGCFETSIKGWLLFRIMLGS